jgi:hypothetical protein
MAVGDFTIDATSLNISGQYFTISGTAEISHTATAFDILPGKHIVSLQIQGADDAGPVQQTLNEDAAGAADEGNCVLQSSLELVNTYNWTAQYR